MAQKTLRINADYVVESDGNITLKSTPGGNITIDTGSLGTTYVTGNLTVQGTTTTVNSTIVTIDDNIIILNSGETGPGVTLNTAGFQIDRGTLPNSSVLWNEANLRWELYSDTLNVFAPLKVSSITLDSGNTVDNIDDDTTLAADSSSRVPTQHAVKAYIASTANTIFEDDSSVTVHDSGIGGYVETIIDGVNTAVIDGTSFRVNNISSYDINNDLTISADGTGEIVIQNVITMPYQVSNPLSLAGNNKFFAYTPGSGGSGLYFVNTTYAEIGRAHV